MTDGSKIVILLILAFFNLRSFAVPAYNQKIIIQLEDGGITEIVLHGDENKKWAVSEDNYTLLPDQDGWVYAQEDEDGYAIPSSFHLSAKDNRGTLVNEFLRTLKNNIPLRPQENAINQAQSRSIHRVSPASMTGTRTALVILMEFIDQPFQKDKTDFEALFNEEGYSEDGAQGSVYDYFSWASHGQLQFYCDIVGPCKTKQPMTYYGKNSPLTSADSNPYALFQEAIEYASSLINLADYDSNGDGYVDNVHIIFSGYGEEAGAPSSAIWSHEMTFEPIMVQDMIIDRYSCAPELRGNSGSGISRIGPHCHEMGHALGTMDYYDTDYDTGGYYPGTGEWDIMASGSWNNEGISPANFNPYVRIYNFGWEEAKTLPTDEYAIIEPSNKAQGHIYRIDTPIEGEFYLIENRDYISFDSSLPDEGLHIYHIGSGLAEKSLTNKINASYPQECYLVCASSEYQIPTSDAASYGNVNAEGSTYPNKAGNNLFSDSSIPSACCMNGEGSNVSLSEITLLANGNISLFNGTLPEPEAIWNGNFEGTEPLSCWNIDETLYGKYSLYASEESGNTAIKPFFQLPEVVEGENYFYVENTGTGTYDGRITSVWIPCDTSSSYIVSFQYYITSRTIQQANSLTAYYRESENGEWKQITQCSDITDEWKKYEANLSVSSGKIQFAFEFKIKALSAISIDNVKIGMHKNASGMAFPSYEKGELDIFIRQSEEGILVKSLIENNGLSVFTLSGQLYYTTKLAFMEEVMFRLPAGVYVLSTKGVKKKLIVK